MCDFPQTGQLMLQENQWTAVRRAVEWKTCKRQTDDRNWHQFRAGLGGSNTFVSWSLSEKLQIVILCSKVLFIPEYGERMAFYAFWSSMWPSDSVGSVDAWRVRSLSSGKLLPIWSMVLGDTTGAQFPEFIEDTCAWWEIGLVRCLARFP